MSTASPERVTASQKARAARVLAALDEHWGHARCELNYTTPYELLAATILSAQSTDAGVNKATPALFARFPTPAHYAYASPAEIEPFIRKIGLFRSKARALHESMKALVERFGGEVPRRMEDLLTLRGVARKTANVVLGNAFGINEGIPVDTHVQRVSARLGLVRPGATPAAIEKRLMALFPRERWCDLSHMLIWHGRYACPARGGGHTHPICREFGKGCGGSVPERS
ncbi:MAG: endonuclease III [Phycisphaeraceae bacterium]|nr:MAG: endonuclease III [Phycisphaeraceae bacterium]